MPRNIGFTTSLLRLASLNNRLAPLPATLTGTPLVAKFQNRLSRMSSVPFVRKPPERASVMRTALPPNSVRMLLYKRGAAYSRIVRPLFALVFVPAPIHVAL